MPFHRQQPASASKLGSVYEHEGMSLCVCVDIQLDNSTVSRRFNACPSPSCAALLPHRLSVWSWWDLELLVGCRLATDLTLISVSQRFHAQHVLVLTIPVDLILYLCLCSCTSNANPSYRSYITVLPLCQTHQNSALTNQQRSKWWRMTWQLYHCWSQLTQRWSPAYGCTAGRCWSKVIQGCVMALYTRS